MPTEVIDAYQLPEAVSRGAISIVASPINIVTGWSGNEQRNEMSPTRRPRSWQVGYGLKNATDRQELLNAYMTNTQAVGLLFKDQLDNAVTDHALALPADSSAVVGDGATRVFNLTRTYTNTTGRKFTRRITRPVASGLVVKVDGVASAFVTLGDLGVITFTIGHAPANGKAITWTGNYLYPVRFDGDFQYRIDTASKVSVPTVNLKELFEV